ncbi:MAG: hypothetical protein K6E69_03030 [Treponema sp.]|uniref:hypothetical protein n=1 Tax=Treponema sp. TaxID=166 RepID=UPI00298E5D83|nr:hypothetical protein [Treponema sp.]MCR5386072.1 hypothetical protein [Treponema sp.]
MFKGNKGVFKYSEWIERQKIRGSYIRPRERQLIGNSLENFNIAVEYNNYLKVTGKTPEDISIYEFSAKLIKDYHEEMERKGGTVNE